MTQTPSKFMSDLKQADDIASLRSAPDVVGEIDYVDVSALETHRTALMRWPLLSELEHWYQEKQHCAVKGTSPDLKEEGREAS